MLLVAPQCHTLDTWLLGAEELMCLLQELGEQETLHQRAGQYLGLQCHPHFVHLVPPGPKFTQDISSTCHFKACTHKDVNAVGSQEISSEDRCRYLRRQRWVKEVVNLFAKMDVSGLNFYSSFRVDGTDPMMSFRWGSIQATSWGLCHLLSIHYKTSRFSSHGQVLNRFSLVAQVVRATCPMRSSWQRSRREFSVDILSCGKIEKGVFAIARSLQG